jgi:phage-related protein
VASAIGRIKDAVLGALRGAGSWLIGVGKDIVGGLISGIKNMAGSVVRALLSLIPGPLKKFANLLGINSPSTVFREFGQNIGQGLVVGVDDSRRSVTASVGRLADTARKAVGAPLRPGTAGPGMSAPTGAGIAFNGPVTTTDVQALAREITKIQRDALVLAGAMGV